MIWITDLILKSRKPVLVPNFGLSAWIS